jgi:hypothetical protein
MLVSEPTHTATDFLVDETLTDIQLSTRQNIFATASLCGTQKTPPHRCDGVICFRLDGDQLFR